jgi:DNA replication protein DnaC
MTNKEEQRLLDIEAQFQDIGLSLMAQQLDKEYRSPEFLTKDRLDLISDILAPEFADKTTKRLQNRLRTAKLIGTSCELSKCVDTPERRYEPTGAPKQLSSLKFIEEGLNVCILGASDSGKTYFAKALGIAACEKYRVSYNRCNEFLPALVDLKQENYKKYEKRIKQIMNFDLLIIDDFLLNTLDDEREIKVLEEVLEKRIELAKSTIVCSQRDPSSWDSMIMNDSVASDCIRKRFTKHYTVMIRHTE